MRIGKLLAAIFGAIVLLAGAGMTTAGALALGVTDGDGWVTTPTARVSTDTSALVGTDIDVDLGRAIDDRTFFSFDGIPTAVEVASRNDNDVFVGIGPATAVADYLAGGEHAIVHFWDDDIDVTEAGGPGVLTAPAGEDFWVASSSTGTLEWNLQSGQWSIVVMNADGSPGVDVAVSGSAQIPFMEAFGIGLLVFGVMAVIGGAVMLYFGVRSDPNGRGRVAAPPPLPSPPAPRVDDDSREPAPVS